MQSIDLNSKFTGRRRRIQKILEYSCKCALLITSLLMFVFFASLCYRGIGAFSQTKIEIEITKIENTTKQTINTALYGLVEPLDRNTKKALRGIVTPYSFSTLQIYGPGKYVLVAHTDVDMYVKGVYNKLNDTQQKIVDELIKKGKIYRTWNWNFWTNSDSRSPEIAGIWGAMIGTFYTIGLAILIAFPIGIGCCCITNLNYTSS